MIALDTNIYIYFLERNPQFYDKAERALKQALQGGIIPVPTITLMEIMSGAANQQFIGFFEGAQFQLCDLDADVATLAGRLRYQQKTLKALDAIHLATAMHSGAAQFVTNDERLHNLDIGIEIVPLSRL